MKALLMVIISIVLIIVIAGCSGSKNANTPPTPEPAKPAVEQAKPVEPEKKENVSIRFTWWGDAKRHDIYNAIADLYEKEVPHVKIVREFGSWNDYWDKLATQMAGGNAPDVIGMHATYVADYARRGILTDLGPYLSDNTIDLGDFPASVKEVGKFDGTTVMVAQGVTMTGWQYNTTVLENLGVTPPDYDWTYDEFEAKLLEVQSKITENGVWASVDNSGEITAVQVFARQKGKELFNADGSLGVTKEDMVEWFSFWDELRKAGTLPDAATNEQYFTVPLDQGLFVQNKVVFASFPFNQIPLYQNYIENGQVKALRRPTDPNGEEGEFVEGSYLAVSSTSKHPEEAAAFINFFVNNDEAASLFKLEQGAQGSKGNNELIAPLLSESQQETIVAIEKSLETAGQLPLPPTGQGEVRTMLRDVAQTIAFGVNTVDEAAEEFIKKATEILK